MGWASLKANLELILTYLVITDGLNLALLIDFDIDISCFSHGSNKVWELFEF